VTHELDTPVAGATNWQREVTIAAALLAFGLLVLPFVVYFVGQQILGDYGDGLGALALAESIWVDLLSFRLAAWVLVLSPYLTIQLARGVRPPPSSSSGIAGRETRSERSVALGLGSPAVSRLSSGRGGGSR
jgi:hypothetical protein